MSSRWLPPEWAKQESVMLTWPHGRGDWAPWLDAVEPVFLDIAFHVSRFQNLVISAVDEAHRQQLRRKLGDRGVDLARVRLYVEESDDTWARDHGPIVVFEDQQRILLDFIFNGWGNKFSAARDNTLTQRLHAANAFGITQHQAIDMVLEGGSIDTDGQGTLLTTTACLLSPQRNPQLDKAAVEQRLREHFGVQRVLWLHHGHLAGDDTDSHVDTLARFCDAHTIAYMACDDARDEHYAGLKAMERELQQMRDWRGAPYRLVPIPIPAPVHDERGKRLPASYVNFLIINGALLLPVYDDPHDALVVARISQCFPDRQVIPVNCRPLIYQYGSLHCVTMQIPAADSFPGTS